MRQESGGKMTPKLLFDKSRFDKESSFFTNSSSKLPLIMDDVFKASAEPKYIMLKDSWKR